MSEQQPFRGPLFVVGMPRSGTKLLRSILNQHPGVSIPQIETEFLPYWVEGWESFGDLSSEGVFRRFHRRCLDLPFFVYVSDAGMRIDADRWYRNCADFTAPGVFEGLIRTHLGLERGGAVIWGDKSPSYLIHMPLLKALYPAARFIHIVRDVRDYCLSINGAWGKNMLRAAQRWADDVAAARAAGASLGKDYLELRYEDLLEQPRHVVELACRFLGIAYDEGLLSLQGHTENLGDAKGVTGIVRGNVRKYAAGLDARTTSRIESIAGRTLVQAGYDCSYTGPPRRIGAVRSRYLQMLDGANLIFFSARERGIFGALRFVFRYFLVSGNRRKRIT